MNRIDRLVAILVFIQGKRLRTAAEIADRFSISLRTVYRDVKALEEAGVPVFGEAGKGYTIEQGYHLPPVMFTRDEAAAMITAEKLVEKLCDVSISAQHSHAMEKVRAVLRYSDKDYIELIENQIHVFQPPAWAPDEMPNIFLAKIQKALAKKVLLKIEYFSPYNNEVSHRQVEPIGICFYSSRWHLLGYCQLRNEYRDFRIDRIKQLCETDSEYTRSHPSVDEYFSYVEKDNHLIRVVVRMANAIAASITEQKYYFGFLSETVNENITEMVFLSSSVEWIGHWLLGFGNKISVYEPIELVCFLEKKAKELADYYLK